MLPRMPPAPPPERTRPANVEGFAQARSPIRRDRHGRAHATLAQSAEHFQTTVVALPVRRRETAPHLTVVDPEPPDASHTRLTPPAPPGLIDRIDADLRHVRATPIAAPKRLGCVRQAVRGVTARALRHDALAACFLARLFTIALGQAASVHLYDQGREHVARAAEGAPHLRAIGCAEPRPWGPCHRSTPAPS